jgi:hypothetical protein
LRFKQLRVADHWCQPADDGFIGPEKIKQGNNDDQYQAA